MKMNEQMKESEQTILHTYNRFPVVFERGEGCCLYDSEGKEYLDNVDITPPEIFAAYHARKSLP